MAGSALDKHHLMHLQLFPGDSTGRKNVSVAYLFTFIPQIAIAIGVLTFVVHCWIGRDSVSSVWHAHPQLRSCEFSVACWTSTAILRVQCGVPNPNRESDEPLWQIGPDTRVPLQGAVDVVHCWIDRDSVSSVWHAEPQLRSCEFSVACWTSTAILRVQCGVLDPNREGDEPLGQIGPDTRVPLQGAVDVVHCWIGRDSVSSVWHAEPQLRSCEFSVACWTPTAILRVQCGVPDPNRGGDQPFWQIGLGTRVPLQGAVDVVHCWVRHPIFPLWLKAPTLLT